MDLKNLVGVMPKLLVGCCLGLTATLISLSDATANVPGRAVRNTPPVNPGVGTGGVRQVVPGTATPVRPQPPGGNQSHGVLPVIPGGQYNAANDNVGPACGTPTGLSGIVMGAQACSLATESSEFRDGVQNILNLGVERARRLTFQELRSVEEALRMLGGSLHRDPQFGTSCAALATAYTEFRGVSVTDIPGVMEQIRNLCTLSDAQKCGGFAGEALAPACNF